MPAEQGDLISPVDDGEHALRLLHKDWINEETGRITSQAFSDKKPSLFIKERLPDGNGELLHAEGFASWGRARLSVKRLRDVQTQDELTFSFTPARPPLHEYSSAHTELHGLGGKGERRAMAKAFTKCGTIEKRPVR